MARGQAAKARKVSAKKAAKTSGNGGSQRAAAPAGTVWSSTTAIIVALIIGAAVFGFFAFSQRNPVVEDGRLPDHIINTFSNHDQSKQSVAVHTSPRPVLGFLTPWNKGGFTTAKRYRGKVTHVSPVWFQIERQGPEKYIIKGEQDVDAEWLQEMAEPTVDGKTVKIVPRVIVETLSQPDLVALLTENIERRAFASTLYQLCTKHKFDGIMLELWSRIQVTPDMRTLLAESVSNIGKRLHNKQLLFGIIVPPLNDSFGAVELRTLQNDVDLFAMNTYDYSQPTTAGPNAPYLWVENCLKDLKPNELDTSKLLMGLNWYGNIYGPGGGQAIIGHQFVDILRAQRGRITTTWNDRAKEHFMQFEVSGIQNTMYYPTERSVAARVELAKSLNVGLSLWELGQGLEHFYDLL